MAAQVMCLTSSGGIPLFSRQKGDKEMITFSKMASLNGVHMFLKTQNMKLLNTDLPDTAIVWKEYEQSIILIIIANGATKYTLNKFLDVAFGAMVLFVGIDEIKNAKNIERLKKDLRGCNPIIDRLLECLDIGDRICTKTDIINMTECIILYENHLLQTYLEGYMECLDSMYGCVLVHGCLAVATNGWWSLDPIERKLLIMTIATETNYTARDLPIFLPYKSPNIAFRLVSITLINHVEVVSLCGPNPELSEIERYAVQCWKTSMDILRNSEQCYLRNVPAALSLDINALGFLLANCKVDKFVLSRNAQSTKNRVTGTHRLDILRTFYHQAIEIFMLSSECEEGNIEMNLESKWKFVGAKETYLCSEYHKCHALKYEDHILCVLYASVVPTHTMRLITEKILKVLLIDKQICW
ncbi:PREDICTED: protein fuzzy homolog isoform X1 [Polistes canadensis]|uniref:protein fuzzy homolog isoform X1 n=1 Tax=Polistes canadensis TaxID=91411 RepID=UPI000718E6CF|nr:PREDICTED: protein fuzzy homolog isoform X1 [Polistes canadensis]XP_014613418.1 PREDICTED: protein fuzzy homolog isoform X1 [Polistes canadensis]